MVFSKEKFNEAPVVGILRGYSVDDTKEIAGVYYEAGFTTLEITMNSGEAGRSIAAVSEKFEGKLNVGAGTVTTMDRLREALEMGARFVVTPTVEEEIITYCVEKKIPVFPGAFTPTEISYAWSLGAAMVKVFPSDILGPAYIKAVLGPLDEVKLMPTGGVDPGNMMDYWKAGARAFGMGGCLFDKELIKIKDWNSLRRNLKEVRRKLSLITGV